LKVEDIDVDAALNSVRTLLRQEQDLPPALRSSLELLLVLVNLLLNRITLNSKTSSEPPSTNPHREKFSRRGKSGRGVWAGPEGAALCE
jgi:transposase